MKKDYQRYFAFGCSYVNYGWATVPDLIAANFPKYYNLGRAGSSNNHILSSLIAANDLYRFNAATDFITIGITGFGRFSVLDRKNPREWHTSGDIIPNNPKHSIKDHHPDHDWQEKLFATELDSYAWCALRSYDAIQSMYHILKSLQIDFLIYPSIDNLLFEHASRGKENFQDYYNLDDYYAGLAKNACLFYNVKESIEEFIWKNELIKGVQYDNGEFNGHPSPTCYYLYIKKHLSMFNTDKTEERYNFLEKIFCKESHIAQSNKFSEEFTNIHREKLVGWHW